MGAIAMLAAVICFWKFASRRAALIVIGFLAVGFLSFSTRGDQSRVCDGRAWFCDLIPVNTGPPPCPDVDPITSRVFQSKAANTEMHRLIDAGVCQQDAIDRIHDGWKAPYDPGYGPWWRKLLPKT
nr:hypothetical protein [uncultured Cupriavidus sp.]